MITKSYQIIIYYKNGMVRSLTEFKEKDAEGYQRTEWYSNGQLLQKVLFREAPSPNNYKKGMSPIKNTNYIQDIVECWDKNGNQIVKNGNGTATFYFYNTINDFVTVVESGKVENFRKEGIWKGYIEDGELIYKENYKNSQLQTGVSYSMESDSVIYSELTETNAQFKGGASGYKDFLLGNLKYPKDAQKEAIEGKAYIQFVVCTDGTLCNYKILQSAGHPSLDAEAMRVVQKSSGKWESGILRGRKVRAKYILPINFKLR